MPSSTFNSDPSGPGSETGTNWRASYVLAFVMVVACVGSWEGYWRDHGFEPSVTDDAGLWGLARHNANVLGEDAVVLVGSSRMQMDVQRDAFAHATGWAPAVQLAVVRGPSVPVLENLANDPGFVGTVICEVNPVLFFADTPNIDHMLDAHFEAFRTFSYGSHVEQRLSMSFQQRFVTRLPDLAYEPLRESWEAGRLPLPSYNAFITEDRYRFGDYDKFGHLRWANKRIARLLRNTIPKVMPPSAFAKRLRHVNALVELIHARGGDVVFIHLPSSNHVLKYEREWWGRSEFWDKLVAATDATTIHYEDDPVLARFSPPDGDHLGRMRAEEFSLRLGELLVKKGVAPGRSD